MDNKKPSQSFWSQVAELAGLKSRAAQANPATPSAPWFPGYDDNAQGPEMKRGPDVQTDLKGFSKGARGGY